jgi:DNA primase
MVGLFSGLKHVHAIDAARLYGVLIARNGRALCPWHDDSHPDLAFYDERCYCHACHNGGDAVALTAQLFGLSQAEAARKLIEDMHITPTESPPQQKPKRQEAEAWRRKRYGFLCQVEKEAQSEIEKMDSWDSPGFKETLSALAHVQDDLDNLHTASVEQIGVMAGV